VAAGAAPDHRVFAPARPLVSEPHVPQQQLNSKAFSGYVPLPSYPISLDQIADLSDSVSWGSISYSKDSYAYIITLSAI
jgi:hypothetical protein